MALRRLASALQGVRQGTKALQNIQIFKTQLEEQNRKNELDLKIKKLKIDQLENELDPEKLRLETENLKTEGQLNKAQYNKALASVAKTEAETDKILAGNKILLSGEMGREIGVGESFTQGGFTRKGITHAQDIAQKKLTRETEIEDKYDARINELKADENLTDEQRFEVIKFDKEINSPDNVTRAKIAFNIEDKEATERKEQFRSDLATAQQAWETETDKTKKERIVRNLKVKYPGESLDINRVFNQRGFQAEGKETAFIDDFNSASEFINQDPVTVIRAMLDEYPKKKKEIGELFDTINIGDFDDPEYLKELKNLRTILGK